MKSLIAVGFAVGILLIACDTPETEAPPAAQSFENGSRCYSCKIVTDLESGCRFLYIDAYKMSGLAAIPGTCKSDSAKKGPQ